MGVSGRLGDAPSGERIGAYGLRLLGVDAAADVLIPAGPDWPVLTVATEQGRASTDVDAVSERAATLRLRNGGEIAVDREDATATLRTPEPLTPHELVHPYLAPVAAVMARWLGRESFHAGAFVAGGGVWAILGEREAGKSTALAWLARRGWPIVCDDMLVVEEGAAYAAPRVLDLRRDAAEHLGLGEGLGVVGARERWRLNLPAAPDQSALRGWVFLTWGETVRLERVPGAERLPRLAPHLGLRVPPKRPEAFLDLIALPAWELGRPRSWEALDEALELLVATLAG